MKKITILPVLFFLLFLTACGSGYEVDEFEENARTGLRRGPAPSDKTPTSYGLTVEGRLENNLRTVTVSGRVSKTYARDVSIKIKQPSVSATRTLKPLASGEFSKSFDLEGPADSEWFEVTVVSPKGTALTDPHLLEVDLTGEWGGDFSITSKSALCERVPIISSLDTPIEVKQEASKLVVYLGGYLNLYPIPVMVDEVEEEGKDLFVSGSGTIGIPPSLARYVGCYKGVAYSFEGGLDSEANPPTFDVDFLATLSGTASDCDDPPPGPCILHGTVTGEKE